MLVGRQTSVMIVRHAEIVLVDAAGDEATMPRRRLSIRRRVGERAGGRAEDRSVRLDAGRQRRHAESDLSVAGWAFRHGAAVNGLARLRRRVLPVALQHLDEIVRGPQRESRQQRSLVVHGYGDLLDVGGLVERRGPTVAVRHVVANGLLVKIRLDLDYGFYGFLLQLVRLLLRRDDRQLRARRVARQPALVALQYQTFVEPLGIRRRMCNGNVQ